MPGTVLSSSYIFYLCILTTYKVDAMISFYYHSPDECIRTEKINQWHKVSSPIRNGRFQNLNENTIDSKTYGQHHNTAYRCKNK